MNPKSDIMNHQYKYLAKQYVTRGYISKRMPIIAKVSFH